VRRTYANAVRNSQVNEITPLAHRVHRRRAHAQDRRNLFHGEPRSAVDHAAADTVEPTAFGLPVLVTNLVTKSLRIVGNVTTRWTMADRRT
jgi:hypothetical protein